LAEGIDGATDRAGNVTGVRGIAGHKDSAALPGGDRRRRALARGRVSVEQGQARSVRGEPLCAGRAEPAGGARDQPGPAGPPTLSNDIWPAQRRHLPVTSGPAGTVPACPVASIRSTATRPLACQKYQPGRSWWQALARNCSLRPATVSGIDAGHGEVLDTVGVADVGEPIGRLGDFGRVAGRVLGVPA